MRTKFIVFLLLLLVFTLTAAPVYALDIDPNFVETDQPATIHGPYTLTQTAHILARHTRSEPRIIVVWFEAFASEKKGDNMPQFQKLPYNPYNTTEILDAGGKKLQSDLVEGQEVEISFTYQMRDDVIRGRRNMEILSCDKIQLVGKALKYGKHIEMQKNRHIGTVIQVSGNQFEVYVEGTYIYDNKREHIAYGRTEFKINSNTKLFSKDNRSISVSSLKPFQRVEVEVDTKTEEMMESSDGSPPQYAGGAAKVIRLLEYGDKWSWCEDNTRSMTMVVEEQRKTNGVVTSLIVKPVSVYNWYSLPKAELFQPSAPGVDFSAYTRGTIIDVTYMAVDNTAEIPAYYYITKVNPEPQKMTEQQLTGLFGKEGDVELRVDSTDLDPGDKKINATWINKTNTIIELGYSYWLEVQKDGKWSQYKSKAGYIGNGVNDVLFYVNANTEYSINYDVGVWTDKLEKGVYRIAAVFSADASYIVTSNEFTVK